MKIVDIADEIFRELGEPLDATIPSIAFWLRSNFGKLGDILSTSFEIVNTEFNPELEPAQKDIFKTLYFIAYYQRQINKNLGAAAYTEFSEIKEGDVSVKRTNKNEVAKSYLSIASQFKDQLEIQILAYKQKLSGAEQFVVGDEFWRYYSYGPQSILQYTRSI